MVPSPLAQGPRHWYAASFAVLGANSTPIIGTVSCTDTGPGIGIFGQVGTTFPGGITNVGPCTITGPIVAPVAASVVADFNSAYAAVDGLNPVCTGVIPIVTTVLPPGVYCSAAGTTIGAGVILTLNGTASDVWVFRVGTGGLGALTLTNAQVVMGGTAQACNVYWKTAEAATVTDSAFVGTVLSGAAVTMTRGSWIGRGMATTNVTLTDPAPMTFAGCSPPASITVNKDFIPNNVATVPVALTCTSGTVTTTPLNAAEGAPAVFQVTGASVGTTCTATETVPVGYTANQANCVGVALNGSCTIINTLNSVVTITVNKDFIRTFRRRCRWPSDRFQWGGRGGGGAGGGEACTTTPRKDGESRGAPRCSRYWWHTCTATVRGLHVTRQLRRVAERSCTISYADPVVRPPSRVVEWAMTCCCFLVRRRGGILHTY